MQAAALTTSSLTKSNMEKMPNLPEAIFIISHHQYHIIIKFAEACLIKS